MRSVANPRARLRIQVKRAAFDAHVGVRALDLDRWGQHLMMKGHQNLEEACGSRGRLRVTDLRLHGPERAPRLLNRPKLRRHLTQAFELRRVSCLRACAVSLNKFNGVKTVTGALVSAAKRPCLALGHRRVDALASSVGRCPDAAKHRIHAVPVSLRILKPLERDHAKSFAEDRSVRGIRERTAIARRRKRGRLAKTHVHEDVVKRVDTARDHHVRLAER